MQKLAFEKMSFLDRTIGNQNGLAFDANPFYYLSNRR